jgi:cobalt-zinc-cadmium efflux system outer membrane protein
MVGDGLSLARAQALAEANAADVRVAEARIAEAQATRVGAHLRLPSNPRLSIDGRPGLDRSSRGEVGYSASLDVLLEAGGAPGARLGEADARTALARKEASLARLDARLRATSSYAAMALDRLRIAHAHEAVQLAERLVAAARERRAAGAGSDVEVTSAEAELAERRAEVLAAEADESLHQMELRWLLGLPLTRALVLSTPIDAPAEAPAVAALRALAAEQRPDLAISEARLASLAAADVRLAKEALPKVGLFGSVDASPASPLFGILGVSVELPLAQRNQGPRAVVAAERQTELERARAILQRLALELGARREVHEKGRAELGLLVASGIPAAQRRFALVEEGWRAGRFDVFRVTAAAHDLVRLRALRVDVLRRIWSERVVLERLTGGWKS